MFTQLRKLLSEKSNHFFDVPEGSVDENLHQMERDSIASICEATVEQVISFLF